MKMIDRLVPYQDWLQFLRDSGVAEDKLPTVEEYWQQLMEAVREHR